MSVALMTLELEPFEIYIGYNGKSDFGPKNRGQRSYQKKKNFSLRY